MQNYLNGKKDRTVKKWRTVFTTWTVFKTCSLLLKGFGIDDYDPLLHQQSVLENAHPQVREAQRRTLQAPRASRIWMTRKRFGMHPIFNPQDRSPPMQFFLQPFMKKELDVDGVVGDFMPRGYMGSHIFYPRAEGTNDMLRAMGGYQWRAFVWYAQWRSC